MSKVCIVQASCIHYSSGTSSRDHYTRDHVPCKHWLAMDCEKMSAVLDVYTFTTGRVVACNVQKIGKIKEGLKRGKE